MKLSKEEITRQVAVAKEMSAEYLKKMLEAGLEPDIVAESATRVALSVLSLLEGSVLKGGMLGITLVREITMEMVDALKQNPMDDKGERFPILEAQPGVVDSIDPPAAAVDATKKGLKDFLN
jgi:hypothetical protein